MTQIKRAQHGNTQETSDIITISYMKKNFTIGIRCKDIEQYIVKDKLFW